MHDYDFGLETRHEPKTDLTPEAMLRLIFDYVGRVANEKELDRLLVIMADMGRELIVADRCTLWLLDQKNRELWTKVAHGIDAIRVPMSAGVVGYAVTHDEPVIINDAYNDSRFNPEVDKKTGYHTRNIIAIPIKNNEGKLIGAYQAINKMTTGGRFGESDAQHLTLAASYSGQALESAMLYKEIEETQKEIIFTMAEVGESRSKETGNHVKRVAEYSKLLALMWGINPEEAELLKMASPMHDIGKIGIPDAILLKPGRLDEQEFEVMKTHATLGWQMLKNSSRPILKAASTVAYEHHEKYNGKGYPNGIVGESIHIYGRITAVADVFDALGSDRV